MEIESKPVDTYVAWIDRITPAERKQYMDRCKEIREAYPLLDTITLGVLARQSDKDLEELFGDCDAPDWEHPPFVAPEEKVVMCFNSREEMDAYNEKHP